MITLEFWDQNAKLVISNIPFVSGAAVPMDGDFSDVPDSSGNIVTVVTKTRHFYYKPDGTLIKIRVNCLIQF